MIDMKQLPWTLLALAVALLVWLSAAAVQAENQRNALVLQLCADPVFKGEVSATCLATVHSREHWWQNLGYALRHLRPE